MKEKLKEKIWLAVVECLDNHATESNIDELLTEAVVKVLDNEKPPMMAVQYIHKRPTYDDPMYGTGSWKKDQVKLVEVKIANKMISHPDVYQQVDAPDGELIEVTSESKDAGDYDETLIEARQAVMSMQSETDIAQFVADNFQGATIGRGTLDEQRLEAIRMIDLFRMPETIKAPAKADTEEVKVVDMAEVIKKEMESFDEYEPELPTANIPALLEAMTTKKEVVALVESKGKELKMKANDRLDEYKAEAIKVLS